MRNINRIPKITKKIEELWKTYCPDWRFGQLMYNFMTDYGDPFYLEDDKFVEKLKEYLEKTFPNEQDKRQP